MFDQKSRRDRLTRSSSFRFFCVVFLHLLVVTLPTMGQDLLHEFRDTLPKAHSHFLSAIAHEDRIYYAGSASTECSPRHFVACMQHDGNELWNTLDHNVNLPRVHQLKVLDGDLYVLGEYDDYTQQERSNQTALLRMNSASGQITWTYVTNEERRAYRPLEIDLYDEKYIMFYAANAYPREGLLQLIDRESGEVRARTVLKGSLGTSGEGIVVDSTGQIYLNHPNEVLKLRVRNDLTFETLWSFVVTDFGKYGIINDVFVDNDNNIYAGSNNGYFCQFDSSTGEIVRSIKASDTDNHIHMAAKIIVEDTIYTMWQSWPEVTPVFNISKTDLNSGKLLWSTTRPYGDLSVIPRSMVLADEGTLLLSSHLPRAADSSAQVGIVRMDVSDGSIISTEVLRKRQDVDWFRKHKIVKHENGFGFFAEGFNKLTTGEESQFEYHSLTFDAEPSGNTSTMQGRAVFPSSVLQMYRTETGVIQLRQHGIEVEVVWLDERLNVERRTTLPRRSNYVKGARMALNSLGQVAVSTFPFLTRIPGYFQPVPGYLLQASLGDYAIHVLSAEGEVLQTFYDRAGSTSMVQLSDFGYDEQNFVVLRKTEDSRSDRAELMSFNADRVVNRSIEFYGSNFEIGHRFLVGAGKVFFVDASEGQGQLLKVSAPGLAIQNVLDWPNFDELIASQAVGEYACIVGKQFSPDSSAPAVAEILQLDLNSQAILWRTQFASADQTRIIACNGAKVFLAGENVDEDSTCKNMIIRCLDSRTGAVEWEQLLTCVADARFAPLEMTVNESELALAGHYYQVDSPLERDSFVMRFSLDGERESLIIQEGLTSGPLLFAAEGSLLHAVHGKLDNDCFQSAAVYRLNAITSVESLGAEGVNDLQMTMYPNPTDGPTLLRFAGMAGILYEFEVSDVLGRRVERRQAQYSAELAGIQSDLRALMPGMYLIRVSGGGESFHGTIFRR